MVGYIYLTTNKVNQKQYIGQHRCTYFDTSYIGSGVLLTRAVEKYGKHNFSVALLEECSSYEEMNEREIYYISKYSAVQSNNFYNIARGGEGHTCDPWNKGLHGVYSPTEKQLQSLEAGRHLPASDLQKEQLRVRRTGIIVTDATRHKLSEASKGNSQTRGLVWITKDGTYKRVKQDSVLEYVASGWKLSGPKQTRTHEQKENYRKASLGRKHIHKGNVNKNVTSEEYETYISNGWVDGYIKLKRSTTMG